MGDLAELGKLAADRWPGLTALVFVVMLTVWVMRAVDRVKMLERLAAAELEWRKEHEKEAGRKTDDLQQLTTAVAVTQQQVSSLAESVVLLRDAQTDQQKYYQGAMEVIMLLRNNPNFRLPPG